MSQSRSFQMLYTKSVTRFSSSVDEQLLLASKVLTCQEWEEYMVVLIDEMHIRYV